MLSLLLHWIRCLIEFIQKWVRQRTGKVITLDSGRKVSLGKQLAEGGFSFVFEAFDENNALYAMKRIHCPDQEILEGCRREIAVHRAVQHPNVMPLFGSAVQGDACFMLFPYCPNSLRSMVNQTNPLLNQSLILKEQPWDDVFVLNLFYQVCSGVQALHDHGFSHRDIKLENVLLSASQQKPLLMDFGSTGPLERRIEGRRDVLEVVEQAAQHTTLPYRSPELFDGVLRVGDELDYRAVDVWSLGCVLFAILYGSSPFECEFVRSSGHLKIIEASHLSVLGPIPKPKVHPVSKWYAPEIRTHLIEPLLVQDRFQRLRLGDIMKTTQQLIVQFGGTVGASNSFHDEGEGIALMSRVV